MSTGAGAGMNRRAQAQAILAGLDRDAALVPAHLVEWWRRYLQVQTPRYLDVIALLNPSGDRLRQFVYVWAGKRNTETTAEEHGAHGGGTEDTERFGPIPKP